MQLINVVGIVFLHRLAAVSGFQARNFYALHGDHGGAVHLFGQYGALLFYAGFFTSQRFFGGSQFLIGGALGFQIAGQSLFFFRQLPVLVTQGQILLAQLVDFGEVLFYLPVEFFDLRTRLVQAAFAGE